MIISLKGFKESGKTAIAMYLEEKHGFKRINFKDALVQEIRDNFPDLLNDMADHYGLSIDELFAEKPTLMRRLMQNYGTNVRRKDKEAYWVERWFFTARDNKSRNIVVDDVRFINEAKMAKRTAKAFGAISTIINITRDGKEGDSHISEQEGKAIKADVTIENNGTLNDLYKRIDLIIKQE